MSPRLTEEQLDEMGMVIAELNEHAVAGFAAGIGLAAAVVMLALAAMWLLDTIRGGRD